MAASTSTPRCISSVTSASVNVGLPSGFKSPNVFATSHSRLTAFDSRIYSGLMIGGKFGTSEFLGRVCDIFNSGSHYTAVCLGGLTALLLAAVQYVSLFELNRK